MKITLMIGMVLAALAFFWGCDSPRGGGMSSDEGFKLSGPMFATDVKQGDRQTVTVSLKRDKYFKQDVTLEITATRGIAVEPSRVVITGDESPDVQLQITAAQDANLGEYVVHVVGIPQTGASTSLDFVVKVVGP